MNLFLFQLVDVLNSKHKCNFLNLFNSFQEYFSYEENFFENNRSNCFLLQFINNFLIIKFLELFVITLQAIVVTDNI